MSRYYALLSLVLVLSALLFRYVSCPRNYISLWTVPYSLGVLFLLVLEAISFVAIIPLTLLVASACCIRLKMDFYWTLVAWLIVVAASYGLATHLFPGFERFEVFAPMLFGASDRAFGLYLSSDTVLASTVLFCLLASHSSSFSEYRLSLYRARWFLLAIPCLFALAVPLGKPIDLKWHDEIVIFLLLNLLVTCVAEETFFRVLIQNKIEEALSSMMWSKWLAALLTTILFTLVHISPDSNWQMLLLVFIAGGIYAGSYAVTKSLEVAITLHFLVNAIHIVGFQYP